jgi:hypothetical protein
MNAESVTRQKVKIAPRIAKTRGGDGEPRPDCLTNPGTKPRSQIARAQLLQPAPRPCRKGSAHRSARTPGVLLCSSVGRCTAASEEIQYQRVLLLSDEDAQAILYRVQRFWKREIPIGK